MNDCHNKLISPYRPALLKNKIVVVDGLVGGGKGLMSSIVGALPKVEMWVHRPKIEQICATHHLGHISKGGAEALIRTWVDEEAYNTSIVRDMNCRFHDASSVFKDARVLRYLKRFWLPDGDEAIQRVVDGGMIINIMTHANAGYCSPLFSALSERLVYVRFTRSPMTYYMFNHLARWSQRWGDDARAGMVLHIKNDGGDSQPVPFFMLGNEEEYLQATPADRAIQMMSEWQNKGDSQIDALKKASSASILEVPYEKFVFEPDGYVEKIAEALGTEVDSVTRKVMKKQRVPRLSLTDAPPNKVYSRLGWTPPDKHMSIQEEFEAVKLKIKPLVSAKAMGLLDEITHAYINRHGIH